MDRASRLAEEVVGMKSQVSTPMAAILIAVVIVIVAVVGWRYFAGAPVPLDEHGRPVQAGPAEAQAGLRALQGIHQQGVQPGQPAPAGQ